MENSVADQDPIWLRLRILLYQGKIVRKTLTATILRLLCDFLSLKNDVNVTSKSNKQKKLEKIVFLLASWRSMTKIAESWSGSISQMHGSADPDPYQNVTDLQHWWKLCLLTSNERISLRITVTISKSELLNRKSYIYEYFFTFYGTGTTTVDLKVYTGS